MLLELIGWMAAICFTLSGVPQAIQSIKTGHANGVNLGMLWLWWWGEILAIIYIFSANKLPLLVNYIFNLIFISIILYYRVFPRKAS